ncbi:MULTISPECIES: alpha/beta hydrolase [unclassified Arenibacter]|jgi:predicted esterase|uniref:alpha/beta hydrolase n=1 Tax=unclassified Arenibacter TaxID=2615047 RepID=UPI000E35454D|nr:MULTISPECIES: esterase [unclassified Arenibacter]MCM4163063.1 esterase [Arenibacter sp. A80]RFT57097.1 esterase [Arenibacter sp. P308M17]
MEPKEKQISYTSSNTYSTMNRLNERTKNVWIIFHGIGFLSRYFIRYFEGLPKDENYIIAPQAPSKYYLKKDFRHVGASWLTKENTVLDTINVLNYMDKLFVSEKIPAHCQLIVLGFSQGVSIATRWTAKSKINLDQLILYAGGIPEELTSEDFKFLVARNAKVKMVLGNKDEFITGARLEKEKERMDSLFNGIAQWIKFDGGHEIKKDVLINLME